METPNPADAEPPGKRRTWWHPLLARLLEWVLRGSCEVRDERVDICVADTGRGIPLDQVERIFEPFVQIDRDRSVRDSRHGVGLGLAISRDLVHQMGGEISVHSVVGHGSTFRFALPRR